jgi:hypothetical protein
MTTLGSRLRRLSLAGTLLLCARILGAQDVPVTPMPVVAPPAAPPAPSVVSAPPADAVALCKDGSFVIAPQPSTDCAPRGGVQVLMPPRPAPPVRPAPAPSAALLVAPVSPTAPPGASMRCKDGTWLTGTPSAARCASNGGVATILPAAPAAAPPPPRNP